MPKKKEPKHPIRVSGGGATLEELAQGIGAMRYDIVAEFLHLLAEDMRRQSQNDSEKGRTRLSARLNVIAQDLDAAKHGMNAAWKICKPYEITD